MRIELLRCVYFERACAHVLLGWLPKIRDLEIKLVLGRHQHRAMMRATRLERAVVSAARIYGGADLSIPRAWRAFMMEVDGAQRATRVLRVICLDLKADLRASYRGLLRRLDPELDAPLRQILVTGEHELAEELGWARANIARVVRRTPARVSVRLYGGNRVPRARWLWSPLDRAPIAERPPALLRHDVVGAAPQPALPGPGRTAAAAFLLHSNIDAEITTMELFARCSYEHSDMPEEFHRDMSRQTSDESRHARACMDEAARYGAPHGTWPISTDVYDFHYQLAPCKAGSRRELLWRLLLRSTFQEALSLDGFQTFGARLAHDGELRAARLLESITADEVFHVQSGLKWSRYLCDGDDDVVFRERAKAHQFYVDAVTRARKAYVRSHPDDAIRETQHAIRSRDEVRERYPFDLRVFVAREARSAAGFTARDLEQVVGWGYAHMPRRAQRRKSAR
jgi:uncharacterized ferritin-like protein (DUF455 family)